MMLFIVWPCLNILCVFICFCQMVQRGAEVTRPVWLRLLEFCLQDTECQPAAIAGLGQQLMVQQERLSAQEQQLSQQQDQLLIQAAEMAQLRQQVQQQQQHNG